MIASYLYNFIFIKTKKTGGTTIEMNLAPVCGPDDIVTPVSTREELLRGNGHPLCRNFSANPPLEEKLRQTMMTRDREAVAVVEKEIAPYLRFTNHSEAAEIKSNLPQAFWEQAYKFTIERHPYEKAISQAYYTYRGKTAKSGVSFERHLDAAVRGDRYASEKYYTIAGAVVVDEFLRCETLEQDLRRLSERLRIPLSVTLIDAKTTTRKDGRPAREILTDAQKEIVYNRCKNEFELFRHEL